MLILITANSAWNIVNFRAGLIRFLIKSGHKVIVLCPDGSEVSSIEEIGCRVVTFPLSRRGARLVEELISLREMHRQIRQLRPQAVLSFTIKNNIYAGLSCRINKIAFFPNVTGLGYAFDRGGFLKLLVRFLYRLAFVRAEKVLMQNPDDAALFLKHKLVREQQIELVPGSGVDLEKFCAAPLPENPQPVFLFVGRLIKEKGIFEFVEAARRVHQRRAAAKFEMIGPIDGPEHDGVSLGQVEEWRSEGVATYLGMRNDVRPDMSRADCVVLPSYREGTPRALLEAAAMGIPIVTTDAPGCREVIINEETGFLCRPRDAVDLADKILRVLDLDAPAIAEMRNAARRWAQDKFAEQRIFERYDRILSARSAGKIKVLVTANSAWNIVNFRTSLIKSLQSSGHEVVIACPAGARTERLSDLDCELVELDISRSGINPIREILSFLCMDKLIRDIKPDVVLSFNIKNNIYAAISCRLRNVSIIPNVTGLGHVFSRGFGIQMLIRMLYRLAFGKVRRVFFQNPDDAALFINQKLVRDDQVELLPGSGVDLMAFRPLDRPANQITRFLFMSRLIGEKGIFEFVEAARAVLLSRPEAKFFVMGPVDRSSPSSVSIDQVRAWEAQGVITYLGDQDDVRPYLKIADCIILPSYYREGTPRALLEAAAMGLTIITTDTPGCREAVIDGVSGFLCRPKDVQDLQHKIYRMMDLTKYEIAQARAAAIDHVTRNFDEKFVLRAYDRNLMPAIKRK